VDQLVSFGNRLIQKDISLKVEKGCIFASWAQRLRQEHLAQAPGGLLPPAAGTVTYDGVDFWAADDAQRSACVRASACCSRAPPCGRR
jgi:phospholipid/cholesterol/gamma-HCH transport system ATP-binding protein